MVRHGTVGVFATSQLTVLTLHKRPMLLQVNLFTYAYNAYCVNNLYFF
jgi:hypothetical protein